MSNILRVFTIIAFWSVLACFAHSQPALVNPPPPANYPYYYAPAYTIPYGAGGYVYQPAVVYVPYRRPYRIGQWLFGPIMVAYPQQAQPQPQPQLPPPQQQAIPQ